MNKHCIIIIDPQKDFISETGVYAKRHPQMHAIQKATKNIQHLLDTKTAYDHIVVYSNYKANQFGEELSMCIPGTDGHELGITFSPGTIILSKTQHSAFTDDSFASFLKAQQYQHIYLCGFLPEYCVMQTALDGLKNGYHISLIQDCIATGDDVMERMQDMLNVLQQQGASSIESSAL